MRRSKSFTLKGYVGDPLWDCELWLFVDADFCGEIEHTKSKNRTIGVCQQKNNFKVDNALIEKMLEDNARRKHCGILG